MALALVGVVTAAIFISAAAERPARADAWAWKDACTAIIYNRTGSQSGVHPVAYVPLLPNTSSIAAFAAYAIVGIPVDAALPLVNYGYPVPTYGCHATVSTTSPVGLVSCAYNAPTTGANHFDCSSNVDFKVIKDDDDIVGNVYIPKGSGPRSPPATGSRPRNGRAPAIRARALPGKGWHATKGIRHLGLIGRLMNQGTPTGSCEDGGNHSPNVVSSDLLVHRGARGVGAVVGSFDTAHAAHQTAADALSRHSMHCLAQLLTSPSLRARAVARPLAIARQGVDVHGGLVVVHRRVHGRSRKAAYFEVIGASKGRRDAVLMLPSAHRATGKRVQDASVNRVLARIGA